MSMFTITGDHGDPITKPSSFGICWNQIKLVKIYPVPGCEFNPWVE